MQPRQSVLVPGDRVAVLSPSFAAPGFAPAVHEQALSRIRSDLGLVPVEFPTTRELGASPQARARDIGAAFADPTIAAVFATLGGDDQITVIPFLDAGVIRDNPKPFFGYSDNTNLLNWLWQLGVSGYYGGSTQVHLGAGPGIDEIHLRSLRAALFTGGEIELTNPAESEDFGPDWRSPAALIEFGTREPAEDWTWSGPRRTAEGTTWGGCLEVIDQIAVAGRMPRLEDLRGSILMLETSEESPPATLVRRWIRALGERGILGVVDGVMVARPPVSAHDRVPVHDERRRLRAEQRDVVLSEVTRYSEDAVICIGVPFGHTRPQWVLPYGGRVRLDGRRRGVTALYG
ncbi:LD-carboxypeptidase [Microbacterium sp. SGAir0570]|uniref:S66 family peptidase n=1 Tax=Microbacterium sp. SGAir0570 TaxID=2070348 RepID=UPI0010CCF8C3|nr:S66 peptidase family protein [Microbacterium sp. SGAir0570]QCR40457.1 LD-carboxypeptidase [Microbacterium sp. SGAir0570]